MTVSPSSAGTAGPRRPVADVLQELSDVIEAVRGDRDVVRVSGLCGNAQDVGVVGIDSLQETIKRACAELRANSSDGGVVQSACVSAEVLRQHMPVHVSEEAREIALDMMDDMAGEVHDGGCYALARWVDAFSRLPGVAQSSDGGVEGHAASDRWVEQSPRGEAHAVFDSRDRSKGLAGIESSPSEALRAIYEWYDRDGSVGTAPEVFEAYRGILGDAQSSLDPATIEECAKIARAMAVKMLNELATPPNIRGLGPDDSHLKYGHRIADRIEADIKGLVVPSTNGGSAA